MRRFLVFFAILLALVPRLGFASTIDAIFKIEVPSGYSSPMTKLDASTSGSFSDTMLASKAFCRDGLFCLSFTGSTTATAFLDEEQDRVTTGLFVISGFLRSYWKEVDPDRLTDIPVPIILYGGDGQLFGMSSGDRATVTLSSEDKRVAQTESFKFNLHINSVTLRLSRRLEIEPFKRASTRINKALTLTGYSIDRRWIDSSSGRQAPFPDDFADGVYTSRESKNVIGFGNYKGFNGALGAPIVNENREVVGIQIGALGEFSMFEWLVRSGLLRYPNTTIQGFETAKIQTSSDQCRAICKDRSGCAAYDHSSSGNLCRLFSTVSNAVSAQGSTAGSRLPITGYGPPARNE
ncbi:PAN domain-containing protein [Rhizobium sp. BK176]|uniref:PAN domain-containing protein n=1 Tax=Rhizobium sp. BK176 TaxID=2587071 RepID=UPI0021690B86|nr:PAN domain-containing protein [Rhizobium sp. BK176]MCS4089229.1 hypothetical protein [Rhizobium sp. BK176]